MQENEVKVGHKPIDTYLLVIQSIAAKNKDDITIQARGKATSKAIDIVEISKNRYGFKIKSIETGTEELDIKDDDGKEYKRKFSTIKIIIGK